MRVEDLLVFGKSHCHSDHAKILLAELLHKNTLELLNYLNEILSKEVEEQYKKEVLALEEGKPLQYVMGHVNFYGNTFLVDERVLIPRFETEELVENTIHYIQELFTEPVKIIDLGCGSGIIGLTLEKKVSTKTVDLVDISKEALEVAKKNGEILQSKRLFLPPSGTPSRYVPKIALHPCNHWWEKVRVPLSLLYHEASRRIRADLSSVQDNACNNNYTALLRLKYAPTIHQQNHDARILRQKNF